MASGSDGAAPVGEDAVHGAVMALRSLGEAVRRGDRLVDVDVTIDVIEQTCVGLSHLRQGAGSVQLNVEALERWIAEEVVGMKTAIDTEAKKVREELANCLGRFTLVEAALTGVTTNLHQVQEVVKELRESGRNLGGTGAGGGYGRDQAKKSIMEHKSVQLLKTLGGDKSQFRQWHQKFISALYAIEEDYGAMVKMIEVLCDTGAKPEEVSGAVEDKYGSVENFQPSGTR